MDKDVAMVARFTGASLGLFAFAVTLVAGLLAENSVTLILTRGITALFVFCLIGLILGVAADAVLAEHIRKHKEVIRGPMTNEFADESDPVVEVSPVNGADSPYEA